MVWDPHAIRTSFGTWIPPQGESYPRLADSLGAGASVPEPFASEWRIAPSVWAEVAANQDASGLRNVFFRGLPQSSPMPGFPELSLDDQEAIAKMGELEQAVAVSLDKAVNGTSLMLMLKIGQAHLLFPGDAQWGLWQAALRHSSTNELLRKTTFFIVSHHGSHNGTPKEFVEDIVHDRGVRSMISTGHVAQWPEIPKGRSYSTLSSTIGSQFDRGGGVSSLTQCWAAAMKFIAVYVHTNQNRLCIHQCSIDTRSIELGATFLEVRSRFLAAVSPLARTIAHKTLWSTPSTWVYLMLLCLSLIGIRCTCVVGSYSGTVDAAPPVPDTAAPVGMACTDARCGGRAGIGQSSLLSPMVLPPAWPQSRRTLTTSFVPPT